ncbi:MAG: molybdenum cofactor guanylyltransferase [Thermotaleaceae bacterium]
MELTGTAIILAGGKSSRMGFDKQHLHINQQSIIEMQMGRLKKIFREIIIVTNTPDYYTHLSCIAVADEEKDFGPLGGMHAGLKNASNQFSYIVACDMPCLNLKYILYMQSVIERKGEDIQAVVTRFGDWLEPFNGFYSKGLLPKLEENIQLGKRRILNLLEGSTVFYIEEKVARKYSPNWEMFINLNTREDIEQYLSIEERKEEGWKGPKG